MINELVHDVKQLLIEKGFYESIQNKDVYRLVALLHTEVSEYTQLVKRHGLDEEHKLERAEEIADIIIRAINLAILEEINLAEVIAWKMKKNFNRPYKYGVVKDETSD